MSLMEPPASSLPSVPSTRTPEGADTYCRVTLSAEPEMLLRRI